MEGVAWGAAAGLAFGLFQATSRRANQGADPYLATFTVIVVSLIAVALAAFATEQPSRLLDAPLSAVVSFALAGISNFFLGWTFLVLAQQRTGAARTSVIAGTAPLFGTAIAFVAIGESISPVALVGVVLVVAGVGLLAGRRAAPTAGAAGHPLSGLVFAFLTAISWGASAVFGRHGLDQLPAPLTGVTVGLLAAAVLYAAALAVRRGRNGKAAALTRQAMLGLTIAGLLVATGISTQWVALGLAPIAIVLALNQLAVPVVLLVAPVIVGTATERLTARGIVGAVVTLIGTLLITVARA